MEGLSFLMSSSTQYVSLFCMFQLADKQKNLRAKNKIPQKR